MYKWMLEKTDTIGELLTLYLLCIGFFATALAWAEGLPLMDGVWLAFVTATSTGYGDIAAKTATGRVLSVLLMHVTIFYIIPLIVVRLMQLMVRDENEFTNTEQELLKEQLAELLRRTEK